MLLHNFSDMVGLRGKIVGKLNMVLFYETLSLIYVLPRHSGNIYLYFAGNDFMYVVDVYVYIRIDFVNCLTLLKNYDIFIRNIEV